MQNKDNYFKLNQKKLKELLYEHRMKRNLKQSGVADTVGRSLTTYQRWEYTGQHLTDIFILLSVFQALDFSTTEIIDLLALPPLTSDEVKALYQDEEMLKSIKENGIYSAIRKKCSDIDDFTLEKLLALLLQEHLKRLESRNKKP